VLDNVKGYFWNLLKLQLEYPAYHRVPCKSPPPPINMHSHQLHLASKQRETTFSLSLSLSAQHRVSKIHTHTHTHIYIYISHHHHSPSATESIKLKHFFLVFKSSLPNKLLNFFSHTIQLLFATSSASFYFC
jgi:hypothetical protein